MVRSHQFPQSGQGISGSVTVDRVVTLKALRAAGPPHSPCALIIAEHPEWWVVVSDDNATAFREFIPAQTDIRTVNHLVRRFKIPKIWFTDPLTIPGEEDNLLVS